MISVSGKTRVYGIIGDPIAHSLSPLMQNRAFEFSGLDAVYVPFRVTPDALSAAVNGLRSLGVAGFNVTVPHKAAILPLLDDLHPHARLIGAVNTVVNSAGRMTGYNTDAEGFLAALREDLKFSPAGQNAMILGAGGAARAAAVALATAAVGSLSVANRSGARATQLVQDLSAHFPSLDLHAVDYDESEYLALFSQADLLVNATSVGLRGEDLNFLPLDHFKTSASIFDMIYSDSETTFIKKAKQLGLSATSGLGMLAAQGQEAFRIWTDVDLPGEFMRRVLNEMRL